jgi:hypothetical protein
VLKFCALGAISSGVKRRADFLGMGVLHLTANKLFLFIVSLETDLIIIPRDDITQFHVP